MNGNISLQPWKSHSQNQFQRGRGGGVLRSSNAKVSYLPLHDLKFQFLQPRPRTSSEHLWVNWDIFYHIFLLASWAFCITDSLLCSLMKDFSSVQDFQDVLNCWFYYLQTHNFWLTRWPFTFQMRVWRINTIGIIFHRESYSVRYGNIV